MIRLLQRLYGLKDQERTGWKLRGIARPESVADHSWGTAFLVSLYGSGEGIDTTRAVRMALVHDLAEAVTGDVPTRVATMDDPAVGEAKRRREYRAMEELLGKADESGREGEERDAGAGGTSRPADVRAVRELWEEYEESRTREALFVRDMNLIDMCMQALVYESEGRYSSDSGREHFPAFGRLDEFFATSRPRIATETGRDLFRDVEAAYLRLTGREPEEKREEGS